MTDCKYRIAFLQRGTIAAGFAPVLPHPEILLACR